jgi:peptidoglycan/xylan/chitin deacetylase (PgdA/CDA1 family)
MGVVFTCSVDDGYPLDMRMAELLSKHRLNGSFFMPIRNSEGFEVLSDTQIREIGARFEVGSHTYSHCYLNRVGITEARSQIMEGKKQLEDVLGKAIAGFCYPGGKHRQRDVELVKAAGFTYARTTMNLCFDPGAEPFEMPTTVQFYPHDRAVYFRNFAASGSWLKRLDGLRLAVRHRQWIVRLYALFDYGCQHGGTFHLWAHSKDIDELGAWQEFDRFLYYVATRVPIQDRLSNEQLAKRTFRLNPPQPATSHF